MAELQNAKGFRAKYINALNNAVQRNQVLSSAEVLARQTENGTFLDILHRGREKRFKIGFGTTTAVKSAVTVGEGFLFASGVRYAPGAADNELQGLGKVQGVGMLLPNGRAGWVLDFAKVKTAGEIEFAVVKVEPKTGDRFYGVAAIVDGQTLEAAVGAANAKSVSRIASIGKIYTPTDRAAKVIEQWLDSDIVLSDAGGGGSEIDPAKLLPLAWEVRQGDSPDPVSGEGTFEIFSPVWVAPGGEKFLPPNCKEWEWNALETDSGSLFAVLKHTYADAYGGGEKTELAISATPPDPSKNEQYNTVCVPLGKFEQLDGKKVFHALHLGIIVQDVPRKSAAPLASVGIGQPYIEQQGDNWFERANYWEISRLADGTYQHTDTGKVAYSRRVVTHTGSHTNGVL